MYPYLINTKNIIIESYSFCFFLAWIIGGLMYYYFIKKNNLNLETMLTILCGCMIGALIGSFLFNLILFGHKELLTKIYNYNFTGMSVIGGISGGFIGVELTKKYVGYNEYTGDLFVFPILFGHTIGRIGCLLGGCCFGTICKLPFGVVYPQNSPAYFHHINQGYITINDAVSMSVHPTQIYEILFNILMIVLLFQYRSRINIKGLLFRIYLISYCSFRFFEEFVRADSVGSYFFGLKIIQINLLIGALYFSWWIIKNKKIKLHS